TARGLTRAAAYGLNDAIFVKHAWQRWGYDYRLPEIYPPAASEFQWMNGSQHATDLPGIQAIRKAAADAGILFCPHDNYIDFYPDAEGFSYDNIVFNRHGAPVKHWYNVARRAQSYRWLPHAFHAHLRANVERMRTGFSPDSLFLDVFTAVTPFDYYDRAGNFYPHTRTAKEWGDAFNNARRLLKPTAPMVSEAGLDALVGSLDGAQSDHFPAQRWDMKFTDAERTPWHDMATHGRFVLFAGGLANRYGALRWDYITQPGHGYDSDDYLSNTVIGGRNPMSDGPFSRSAVMTYWLLHDVCASLARATFETHAFGSNVHQQHTTFSNGGKVWTNRGKADWEITVDGRGTPVPGGKKVGLPEYGFYAETPESRAGVVYLSGRRAAFSISKGIFFADARPASNPASGVNPLTDFGPLATNGAFRLFHDNARTWRLIPLPDGGPFHAELRLKALNAGRRKIKAVEILSERGEKPAGSVPRWKQTGDVLTLDADGKAFGYRIVF
ncbi:MAG: hypothetical protein LBV54_01965, partial [Puniceicoccales bacterium]|nr:hypothetical protein [Puniceicoccales bacterium]